LRWRPIAAVVMVLALTVAGFIVARALAQRDANRESERRIAVAGAQIESQVEVATSLTESLSEFMVTEGATGVTNDEFATNVLRWLSPAGIPAAAWAEEVQGAGRAAYERRNRWPIVAPDARGKAEPGSSFYLPASLVSGLPPMNQRGVDLNREPGIAAALHSAIVPGGVGATPVAARSDGTRGLFLVAPAPNAIDGVLRPGAIVVFLSEATLRAAAGNPAGLRFLSTDASSGDRAGAGTVHDEFAVAGQQLTIILPKEPVSGPGATLPWIILAGGLLLAGLAGALAVIAVRRARAQRDFDRIFNLSPDLVAVADFDGHFTRVNPAAEEVLGYTQEELLARPYLDFVHPDDRERTAAEAAAIGKGKTTMSFENRLVRKDGSLRVFDWTAMPVVEDAVMYGVARDVTERWRAETESERLAAEQSALRRVAEQVARQAPSEQVFALVTEELSRLLEVSIVRTIRFEPDGTGTVVAAHGITDSRMTRGTNFSIPEGSVVEKVFRTGLPARLDDFGEVQGPVGAVLRDQGAGAGVGGPIVVDGRLWGVMAVGAGSAEALPPGSEGRVAQFAELVSTAISNIESRGQVERLVAEQSALRRVAMLVARHAPAEEVFALVTDELSRLLRVDVVRTIRFEPDGSATVLAAMGRPEDQMPPGTNMPIAPGGMLDQVFRTGRPSRYEDYSQVGGPTGAVLREEGVRCAVGGPIVVDGRLWGAMVAAARTAEALPSGSEDRVAQFAELVSTAISNIESRARVEQLAAEQAALRRVAELVARQASPEQVFGLVTEELNRLLEVTNVGTARFEPDGTATIMAIQGTAQNAIPAGTSLGLEGGTALEQVFHTGRPAHVENYKNVGGQVGPVMREVGAGWAAAGPIVVEGRMWGAMVVSSAASDTYPPGAEQRVAQFAELVSTAISNIESRAKVERLAAEQSALRRVATLVAREHSPDELFATLVQELGVLLDVDATAILRYETDSSATVIAGWSGGAITLPVGARLPLEGENLAGEVQRTGLPRRKQDYGDAPGVIADTVRELGVRSAVASPIVVEGATWGVIAVLSRQPDALAPDTEARIAEFTRQAGLAVANAKSRADLAESRARIVRAGDVARRRFERDLHDGAQQRLVSLGLELRTAEATVPPELDDLRGRLSRLGTGLNDVLADLRELSRGLHPAVLSEDGLSPALSSLALRSAVPVDLRVDLGGERFEEPVEVAAYYVASEALTNSAKHACASQVEVRAMRCDGWLELIVSDDGRGGADASSGSGLTGLVDRVEAIGGTIHIDSRPDIGTAIHVKLPTKSTLG